MFIAIDIAKTSHTRNLGTVVMFQAGFKIKIYSPYTSSYLKFGVTRSQNSHIRFGTQEGQGRRVSLVYSSGFERTRAVVVGGARGGPRLLQQVPDQELRQGRVSYSRESPSVSCAPHKQDDVVRGRRTTADGYAWSFRQTARHSGSCSHRPTDHVSSSPRTAQATGDRGAASSQVQVSRQTEDLHIEKVRLHQVYARGVR